METATHNTAMNLRKRHKHSQQPPPRRRQHANVVPAQIIQQQQQQPQRRYPTRQHGGEGIITNNNNTTDDVADGLVAHLNLSKTSIRHLSKKAPIMGSKYRSIRHVFQNETNKYVSKVIFQEIVHEVITELKKKYNIDGEFQTSDWGSWVLAPTVSYLKAHSEGPIHRDTKKVQVGYLTVLIFLGRWKDDGYGDVTIFKNSQNIKPGTSNFTSNNRRFLNTRIKNGEVTGEDIGFVSNCVVFDSRLVHYSHFHRQYDQRTALSFHLYRKGLVPIFQDVKVKLEDGHAGKIFHY